MNRKACFVWFLQAVLYSALQQDAEQTIWTVRKTVLIGRLLSTREEKMQKRGKEGIKRGGEETRIRSD